ncbi:hypothetical protein [Bacillus sp. SD075]
MDKKQVRRWVRYFEAEGILGLEEKRGKAKGLVRADQEKLRRIQKKKSHV